MGRSAAVDTGHLVNALPLRTAAFVVGCNRVLEARSLRGLYP